jgi:hypothetical protein
VRLIIRLLNFLTTLADYQQLSRLYKLLSDPYPIEIDARAHETAIIIPAIPHPRAVSGTVVHRAGRSNKSPGNAENLDTHGSSV